MAHVYISLLFSLSLSALNLIPRAYAQQYKYIRANIVLHLADSSVLEVFSSLLTY